MERQQITPTSRAESKRDPAPAKKRSLTGPAFTHPLLRLQQSLGNRAVGALLQKDVVQAKLKIGKPGDEYEQEADRVANAVMSMAEPSPTTVRPRRISTVQRKCKKCEEEEARRQPEEVGEEELQAKPAPGFSALQAQMAEEAEEEESQTPVQRERMAGEPEEKFQLQRQPVEQGKEEADERAQTLRLQTQPEEEREEEPASMAASMQRQASGQEGKEEEEEEAPTVAAPLQRQPIQEEEGGQEEPLAQAKSHGAGPLSVSPALESRINSSLGRGRPLSHEARSFFEPRFGYDFGSVRLHTGASAGSASRNLKAQAFTLGRDIFFGDGHYRPQSTQGQRLLAHELTHVVQQNGGSTVSRLPQSRRCQSEEPPLRRVPLPETEIEPSDQGPPADGAGALPSGADDQVQGQGSQPPATDRPGAFQVRQGIGPLPRESAIQPKGAAAEKISSIQVPSIQRLGPLTPVVAAPLTPVIVWGGRYLAGRLARWGIKKIFEKEEDLVDYGEVVLKELLKTPIDLMGMSKFAPPTHLERHIKAFSYMVDWYLANKEIAQMFGMKFRKEMTQGPKVNIKFGSLGSREGVPIRWHADTETYEMDPHFMKLTHPAFADKEGKGTASVPFLALGIDRADSKVYGGMAALPAGLLYLSAANKASMRKMMNRGALSQLVFGDDYNKEHFTEVVYLNDILSGSLNFQVAGFQKVGGNQTMVGSFALIDDSHAFQGFLKTKVKGIPDAEMPLERDSKSRISGRLDGLSLAKDWSVKADNYAASLEASYVDGVLDIRGDASYTSDRIPEANLTILVTTKRQAWEAAEKRLPPQATKKDRQFLVEDELAITGWGSMEIVIVKDKPGGEGKGENFLTGKAAAVVDPDGYLTMSGAIIMKDRVTLLKPIGGDLKDVYKKARRRLAYVRVYPGIGARIMGEAGLKAGYQIGPVELYELSVSGIYSNNPELFNQLELTARIDGVAGLKAEAEIKGDIELRLGTRYDYLGASPAKVSLGINATGQLSGYMDFAPTIGIKGGKKGGKGGEEKDAENLPKYFFKGSLTVGGELDLEAALTVALSVPGTKFEGKYPFLKRTVPGAGIAIDWDYTLGDPLTKESLQKMTKIRKGQFNPPRMMREMFQKKEAKETDELKGEYKEGKKKLGTVEGERIPIPEHALGEREVKDDFKMMGVTHHLILHFDSAGKPPDLKMATNPELIVKKIEIARNRLAQELPDLDADDRKLLEERLTDLDRIKRGANKVLSHARRLGVAMKDLKKADIPGFEELGDLISQYGTRYGVSDLSGEVSDSESPGTESNPFEIEWPKPPSVKYEPLYFGGRLDEPRSQGILRGLHKKGAKDRTSTKVREYKPHEGGALPGGEKIGISRSYRTFENRVIGPLSEEGTPGGDKLNRILKRYGFLPGRDGDGMDADHIVEIQFGGKDVVPNLWPLDSDINQASGRKLKDAEVAYPKTGRMVKIKDLKKKLRKYYFKITKFRY